jgi:3-hydroxybutyryl-CoA dehydrogenase
MAPIRSVAVVGLGSVAEAVSSLVRRTGIEVIEAGTPLEALDLAEADVDVAIECTGPRHAKRAALEALDSVLDENVPLLTLGWTATATEAATWCKRNERIVGFSLMPPVGETGTVVELAPSMQLQADDAVCQAVLTQLDELWQHLGCGTERINDQPGMVLPSILFMVCNEAAYALMQGVATAEAIDTAMRLGANYPRGPLAWADQIGLDLVLATLDFLHVELGDDRYRACPLLRQLVRAGRTGRHARRGFYEYSG